MGCWLTALSSFSPARISASRLASVAEVARRLGDRAVGLGAAIAEIDQRRDRVAPPGRRTRAAVTATAGATAPAPSAMSPALSFSSVTMRCASFGPTPGARVSDRLVLRRDRLRQLVRRQHAEDRQRHPRADALHGRQQAEPVALGRVGEAVEVDRVLAHMRLDQQRDRRAGRRRAAPACAPSRMHE